MAFLFSQIDPWTELKTGLGYFKDDEMVNLLKEMEEVYRVLKGRKQLDDSEMVRLANADLDDDPELYSKLNRLDSILQKIVPETIRRIGDYIRSNPNEFVELED